MMSAIVQVSRTPASQNHPRAPTTGVREAPRHEIAGRKGLCFAAAIYGDLRSASVCFREAGTTDARQVDWVDRSRGACATGIGISFGVAAAIARRWRSIIERAPLALANGQRQEWQERTALRRGR